MALVLEGQEQRWIGEKDGTMVVGWERGGIVINSIEGEKND